MNNNGIVIEDTGSPRREVIPPEQAEEAGRVFGEGRESLVNLITYCVTNGIRTYASCAGHEKTEGGRTLYSHAYITFALEDDKTKDIILALFSRLADKGVDRSLRIARYVNVESGKNEDRYVR